jgi:hypothetical protein
MYPNNDPLGDRIKLFVEENLPDAWRRQGSWAPVSCQNNRKFKPAGAEMRWWR